MYSFWTSDYSGDAFELFGTPHLIVLVIVSLVSVWMLRVGTRMPAARRRSFRISLAAVLVVNELLWHLWALTERMYTAQEMLPLHLCSVMVWVSAYALATGEHRLYGLMYFLGIAGAAQALVTPDAGIYGFPHFRFLQTMISHGLVFVAGVWVAAVEGYRPTVRSAIRIFVGLNIYALAVGLINVAVGSNYLYVNAKPPTPSIIDMMPAWPWYLLHLELIALVLLGLLYLPFLRRGRRGAIGTREQGTAAETVAARGPVPD